MIWAPQGRYGDYSGSFVRAPRLFLKASMEGICNKGWVLFKGLHNFLKRSEYMYTNIYIYIYIYIWG